MSARAVLCYRLADAIDRAAYYQRDVERLQALCDLPHGESAARSLRFQLECRVDHLAELQRVIAGLQATIAARATDPQGAA